MKSRWLAVLVVAAVAFLRLTKANSNEADKAPVQQAADPMHGKQAGQMRDDNGLKMKLVWCPPGEFKMENSKVVVARAGEDTRKEDGWEDADLKPGRRWKRFFIPVKVSLTQGYWLGKHEVNQAE